MGGAHGLLSLLITDHFLLCQDNLPTSMGQALNQLSTLDEKDNKVYPTWDAAVERLGTKLE